MDLNSFAEIIYLTLPPSLPFTPNPFAFSVTGNFGIYRTPSEIFKFHCQNYPEVNTQNPRTNLSSDDLETCGNGQEIGCMSVQLVTHIPLSCLECVQQTEREWLTYILIKLISHF